MSGGAFDYSQYHITTIADSIQSELDKQGTLIPTANLYSDYDWYKKHPEEKYYPILPENIQHEFKTAIEILRKAAIYAQRIDWFLSGDDGPDTFIERLKEDLSFLDERI